jgi:hypothetical protein
MYSKNRFPMYEGDSYIHPSPVQFPSEAPSQSENHLHRAREDSPKPRTGTARALLLRIADWFDRALQHPRRKALEDYLARSSDLADLERRLQRIERDARFIPS